MAYGIKCNIKAPHRFFRRGALCWVAFINGGGERYEVYGMSRGGRMVRAYVDLRDLTNFRPGWVDDDRDPAAYRKTFPTREAAAKFAASMNEQFGAQPVRPHAAAFGRSS